MVWRPKYIAAYTAGSGSSLRADAELKDREGARLQKKITNIELSDVFVAISKGVFFPLLLSSSQQNNSLEKSA